MSGQIMSRPSSGQGAKGVPVQVSRAGEEKEKEEGMGDEEMEGEEEAVDKEDVEGIEGGCFPASRAAIRKLTTGCSDTFNT